MTLPIALMGTDLIGQARTGTGKTLAFGIPVLQRIVSPHDPDYAELAAPGKPQALVVTPTRELAIQVAGTRRSPAEARHPHADRSTAACPTTAARGARAGVDIVVGTPGPPARPRQPPRPRPLHVKSLVLDEADEMLDLGFLPDVETLLSKTPELRQTMLFSATMPGAIVTLARKHMRHPMNIRAESPARTTWSRRRRSSSSRRTTWTSPRSSRASCRPRTRACPSSSPGPSGRRSGSPRISTDRGFPASPLHGDMAQVAREKALKKFRDGKINILVATDVAARGIDVAGYHARHQLHLPRRREEVRPPHRPHRPGRRLRHRDHVRRLGRSAPAGS